MATIFLLLLTAVLPVNAQLLKKEKENLPVYPSNGGSTTWMKTFYS